MIQDHRDIPLLSERDQVTLLDNVSRNPRHELMVLIMIDCGLRVTELISLRVGNFDFQRLELKVASLKKRSDKPVYREIPLTPRVVTALSEVYLKLKDKSSDAYLFPTNGKTGHISRQNVWKMLKRYSSWTASPHMLRHTFATEVVKNGADIRIAKDLLGHASYKTTEIYLHVADQERRSAIERIDKRSRFQKLKDKYFPKPNVFILNNTAQSGDYFVGRKDILKEINDLFHKKVNLLILGPQGIGKSRILQMLNHEKILRLDDFKGVKTTIGNILLELYNGDKEKVIQLLTEEAEINKVITKNSVPHLIKLLINSTEQNEYTLIIDDITSVTPSGVTALEKLKNHFHIIAAARQVKMSQASFLSNFQKLAIKPLNRVEATQLIVKLSHPMKNRIEDYETYKNHIYDQTDGNPLFIIELIERFGKEPVISVDHIRDIRHTAALREIDMSVPVVILFSSLMVLRYIGGEFEDDSGAFRLFGGIFLLFALFARSIFNYGKRKWV
jgi:GTPase SAR1 family protein